MRRNYGFIKRIPSKGITTINVKTNSFMEESKCKTYISTLEKEIQILKQNIGETVYAKSVAGESYEEEVAGMIGQIRASMRRLSSRRQRLNSLQFRRSRYWVISPRQ